MEVNFKREQYEKCVFLEGVYGDSNWRQKLIAMLNEEIPYFNPQNTDWTDVDFERQKKCKEVARIKVWVVTEQSLDIYTGMRIYEEVIATKDPKNFIFCAVGKFEDKEKHCLDMTKAKLQKMGAVVCKTLKDVANELHSKYDVDPKEQN